MTVMCAPTSLAIARPIIVFPVPGGPYSSTPLGGGIPKRNHMIYYYIQAILITINVNRVDKKN